MKITYLCKETLWSTKVSIDILDFDGMEKEAQKLLEHIKAIK